MSRIIELNDSPLRAVINDQGKIAQIIDERGNDMGIPTVAVDPLTGGIAISDFPAVTPRLRAAVRALFTGQPADITLFGDSTGDELAEWFGQMGYSLAAGLAKNYSVAYRLWADASQQYSGAQYLSIGPQGRRYISAGKASTSHRIELVDSARTSATSDLDVRVLLNLNGGGAAQFCAASKFGGAGQRSWRLEVTNSNALFFEHSADGTAQINRTSAALAGVQLTSDIWLRCTLDVDNGASGNTVTFFTSADGATWTQLGSPDVKAGATSVFDSTAPIQMIGRGGGSITSIGKDVRFYELQVYGSLDGTNRIAWIDVGSVPTRSSLTSIGYTDDCGNSGTIYYQASTIVGSPRLCLFNGSVGGQVISYAVDSGNANARFSKMSGGQMNIAFINYGHNEGGVVAYGTNYKQLTDLIVAKNAEAAAVGVLQNRRYSPATNIIEHEMRNQAISRFCAVNGFDVIDFFGLVKNSEMKNDGIHPEPSLAGVKMGALAYLMMQVAAGAYSVPE